MKILVTGANGFIGKNLITRINELDGLEALPFVRGESVERLEQLVKYADKIVHLAGENRPFDPEAFEEGNTVFTKVLCGLILKTASNANVIFASSAQALFDNPYGRSKLLAEQALRALADFNRNRVLIYRLPGVFGKWSRPNYNSVVATFCHNISRGLPIRVDDPDTVIQLVYVDDVIEEFMSALTDAPSSTTDLVVRPAYTISLGDLEKQVRALSYNRSSLVLGSVGTGFIRALYSTYLSFLSPKEFSYSLVSHADERGVFVEMLKTPDSGQISFFTAGPGITRGGHYHHTKSEKFLVVKGTAKFGFRHILTDEKHSLTVSGSVPQIVESIPGWSHDVCNVGSDDLIVMLWANEIFDNNRPDTVVSEVL